MININMETDLIRKGNNKRIIIGITGTLGAGKGTIVECLKNKGFQHYSVREYLVEEIKRRGLPINRDSMVKVANELRKKHSPSYLAEQLYKQAKKSGQNCVIESLRTLGEIEALRRNKNFYLLAVDADPKTRYDRIIKRQSETDQVSFKKFIEDEKREMVSTDPNKQNLSKCIEMADFRLDNSGTIEELYKQVNNVLQKIFSRL